VDAFTEFEAAILERIAMDNAAYRDQLTELIRAGRVAEREWTGAGGYITVGPNTIEFEPRSLELDAEAIIEVPGLKHGLGAMLFVRQGRAEFLELFTYEEAWWGEWAGFRIVPTQVTRGTRDAT
jgi:hypothetical protein